MMLVVQVEPVEKLKHFLKLFLRVLVILSLLEKAVLVVRKNQLVVPVVLLVHLVLQLLVELVVVLDIILI